MSAEMEIKKVTLDELDNTELVRAMKDVKTKKSHEAELEFVRILGQATMLTPAIVNDKRVEGKQHIQFMTLKTQDGHHILPAFTNREELAKYDPDAKLQPVICNLAQYIEMITSEGGPFALVIDPFGENIIISKEILKSIKAAGSGNTGEDQIRIADLKEQPEEIVRILKEFFDEEGTVEKAYIQLMKRGENVSFLLIVDKRFPDVASDEELRSLKKDLYDRIAETIRPAFERYVNSQPEYVGIDLNITDYASKLGREVAEGREPFYIK